MTRSTKLADQQERLLRARISLALSAELHRRPTDEELDRFLRVLCQAVRGVKFVVAAVGGAAEKGMGGTRGTEGGNACS
jgi:hypothetical protein